MNNTADDNTASTHPGVFPTFQAHDADAQLRFLTDLGFVENVVYRDGDQIAHAQLDWPGGGSIMFGSHKPGAEWSREPGTAGTYLVATDVAELFDRAERLGATIIRPLQDTDYGSREFTIADPEGNLWSIGTYAGEPSKA
ncbi:VOC family protein [Williamsia sterculiae]|uniref:Uncharacterized conserved protein PhnB, glyoxalase superfamily n=1 Tax=Williamsia sterculiae TaxID=1344003 RepID=A0A1N7H2Y1_9NOCA|nr:VOC family protein [Williamsia sterculiae]SIS19194.1 Uncharacterized conserved protein PhnB, glyoxalase superfamily [Williamsia sterculiae]